MTYYAVLWTIVNIEQRDVSYGQESTLLFIGNLVMDF